MDELRLLAALGEADRAQVALHELGHDPRRVAERAGADAELGVEQLRVPERDRSFRPRRGVVADCRRVDAEERMRELAGVRDRRRGKQKLRLRAVHACQTPQAAEHVADVRAEDAAVHVRLVDDDVAQVVQHVGPQVVPREHADVEHVGIREHEVRPLADLPAPLGRRVAVVDRGTHAWHGELAERARLVLRKRLRRVEVERAVLRLARERVEDGQVERERLSRCSAGRDDQVLAALRCFPRFGLVRVELGDALPRKRLTHLAGAARREAVRCARHAPAVVVRWASSSPWRTSPRRSSIRSHPARRARPCGP